MQAGTGRFMALILCLLGLLVSCDSFKGLSPVSGLAGELEFSGTWPDTITAAAVVVLDPLAAYDPENVGDYLIGYSNPDTGSGEYFIQLEPGNYIATVVGLKVDPGLFAKNSEKYLMADESPFVILTDLPKGFLIKEEEINEIEWLIIYEN